MIKINLELSLSEYKILKKIAKKIFTSNNVDTDIEDILIDSIRNNKVEKGVYYKTEEILLILGYNKYNHTLKAKLGKVLRKNDFYHNTTIRKWKIK